jgi:hypothetical protein
MLKESEWILDTERHDVNGRRRTSSLEQRDAHSRPLKIWGTDRGIDNVGDACGKCVHELTSEKTADQSGGTDPRQIHPGPSTPRRHLPFSVSLGR